MTVKKKYKIAGLTPAQQAWLQNYEDTTMLEPLNLEDLAADPTSFNQVAKDNIRHFEGWMYEAMSDISTNVPYNEEKL